MHELRLAGIKKEYSRRENRIPANAAPSFSLNCDALTVQGGELFALLGPSGCGKTTLLKLVAGLLMPDRGEVFLGSQRITALAAEKRGFGMVFQQPLLFPHLTVEENVAFGLKMQGISSQERLRQAREMLTSVDLSGLGSRRPSELSGGQQQRVSLARAIVARPHLLLMDEPFSSLDPSLRAEMRDLVGTLHKEQGVTILFVTHDREEAFVLADRIGVMKDGAIIQVGTPQELYENPQSPFVALFLGAGNVIPGELSQGVFISHDFRIELPSQGDQGSVPGWLVIRPESLQVVKGVPEPTMTEADLKAKVHYFQGTVKQISYRQGFYHMTVDVGAQVFAVVQKADSEFYPTLDEPIILQGDVQQIRFIPR